MDTEIDESEEENGFVDTEEIDESEEENGFVDTEERVREAMARATDNNEGKDPGDVRVSDLSEKKLVDDFTSGGCGCTKGPNNSSCSSQFERKYIASIRDSCFELSHDELDLLLIGQIMACTSSNSHSSFFHQGKRICKKMFFFFHGISQTRLSNIKRSMKQNGIVTRAHGNMKRIPHNALSFDTVERVVKFITSYAEQNGLVLPGRVPGYSRSDLQLLPSSMSKRKIWNIYSSSLETTVSYTSFCRLWRNLIPSVIIMKPMTDLCWQCQQNNTAVIRSANCSEEDKSVTLKKAEEHLRIVSMERSYYNTITKDCAESVRVHYRTNSKFAPPSPL